MTRKTLACLLLWASTVIAQESDAIKAIEASYTATFERMRQAKKNADIEKMVDAMDAPEWFADLPTGETLTRSQAIQQLSGLLAVAPENRPIPQQQILYTSSAGGKAVIVYWVYRVAANSVIGSLARDTWVRTPDGFRRIRHQKLFPDRPLIENGKPVVLPTL